VLCQTVFSIDMVSSVHSDATLSLSPLTLTGCGPRSPAPQRPPGRG